MPIETHIVTYHKPSSTHSLGTIWERVEPKCFLYNYSGLRNNYWIDPRFFFDKTSFYIQSCRPKKKLARRI